MGILEIIAEQHLGVSTLKSRPLLRLAFENAEKNTHRTKICSDEKARIVAIVELCLEYARESDHGEKTNILRTLEEISANESLEIPTQSIEDWDSSAS